MQYHGTDFDAEEIATMKYNFFNDVISKLNVSNSGIGNGDGDGDGTWSSTQL